MTGSLVRPDRLDAVLREVSARFVNLRPTEIGEQIRGAIGEFGTAIGVDRGVVYPSPEVPGERWEAAWEWCAPGIPSYTAVAQERLGPDEDYSWYTGVLQRQGLVRLDDLGDIPPGATPERDLAAALHLRSVLALPLLHREERAGILAFFSLRERHPWTDREVVAVQILGNLVIDAVLRVRTERRLSEDEALFRAMTEASFAGILISRDGVTLSINQAAADLLGYTPEEMVGMTPEELAVPDSARRVRAHIEAASPEHYEATLVRKDGGTVPVEIVGQTISYHGGPARVTGLRDLTARRRAEQLEEQVRRTRSLESLGVLAGGIAHDFNNLLVGILGNVELAMDDSLPGSRMALRLERIWSSARRAAALTAQMLTYAGRRRPEVRRVDLAAIVREVVDGATSTGAEHVVLDLEPDVPPIDGDPAQLRQVVSNLLSNALEAVGDPRRVRVAARLVEADAQMLSEAYLHHGLEPGRYVALVVEDRGHGMDETQAARIFEPFYSTKFPGRGLGLAAVLGVVQTHHGTVLLRTQPGGGTTFTLLFPPGSRPPTAESVPVRDAPYAGVGRALVVDDEPEVRAILRELVQSFGFEVVEAASGAEALERSREQPSLAVAVVDLTMPGMSGVEVLDRLREERSDLPVVLASGYDVRRAAALLGDRPGVAFLHKPFDRLALAGALKQAIEG